MNIGVTGSKGFIGSSLSSHLAVKNPRGIRLLARESTHRRAGPDRADFSGDLMFPADCERFCRNLDLIYHLAHTNTPINSDIDLASDARLNLVPLLNMLQAIQHLGTKPHLVYFSSGGAVYAPASDRVPFRETDWCSPQCSYGIQKLAAEHYLRLAAQKGYLTATVLRVGNAYGALLPQYRMQGLIGVAINNIVHGKPVRIFGDLNNVRDYVHLRDICAIAWQAAVPRQPFTIINVGSGVGHSVADIIGLIQSSLGKPIELQCDTSHGQWLTDWVVLDNAKASQEFGWRPEIDLRSGIEELIAGLRAEVQADAAIA
jgi:UDP-glucose 4-epimerase